MIKVKVEDGSESLEYGFMEDETNLQSNHYYGIVFGGIKVEVRQIETDGVDTYISVSKVLSDDSTDTAEFDKGYRSGLRVGR